MVWFEPGVHDEKPGEALDEQPGPGQQHESQRDLRDNERFAKALMLRAGGCSAAAFLKGQSAIRPGALQRRRDAEQEPGHDADDRGEHEGCGVDPGLGDTGEDR